jgi:hypothetical protein
MRGPQELADARELIGRLKSDENFDSKLDLYARKKFNELRKSEEADNTEPRLKAEKQGISRPESPAHEFGPIYKSASIFRFPVLRQTSSAQRHNGFHGVVEQMVWGQFDAEAFFFHSFFSRFLAIPKQI